MCYPLVLTRASRGEPWRCLLVNTTDRVGFLVGEEDLATFKAGECQPVGVPMGACSSSSRRRTNGSRRNGRASD